MNIVLISDNIFKKEEFREIFGGYGINLLSKEDLDLDFDMDINNLFKNMSASDFLDKMGKIDCYILREDTYLEDNAHRIINDVSNLQVVSHISCLKVHYISKDYEQKMEYKGVVKGFIDLSKRKNSGDIYNWDDIFVCSKTLLTYHEMKGTSGKHSARTKVIAEFLNDKVFYDKKIDLKHNPLGQAQVVEFNRKIYNLIQDNEYLSTYKNSSILNSLMKRVLKNGVFTRSASNRKQRNYWFPVFNAGLPLTPKSDEIHEITFMFHDLMHHVIPDLIIDQNSNSLDKDAYIIHRMMSEAITIVLADMLYIDNLAQSGIKYDWLKRKIYPVYQEMNIKELTPNILKKILWANINFALLGDDSMLLTLSKQSAVNDYKSKYEKFFIEDYRWTINNYNAMIKNIGTLSKWFEANVDFIPKERRVSFFSKELSFSMNYDEKVKIIFEKVWNQIENMILDKSSEPMPEESISNAFKNYMIGQTYIFFDYDYLKESNIFYEKIKKEFMEKNLLTAEDIKQFREFFNLYIEILEGQNRVSSNVSMLYREMVPIFDPFYVFYDSKLKYSSIKELLASEVLN